MNAPLEATRLAWTELNRQWLIAAIARLRQRLEARIAGKTGTEEAEDAVEAGELTGFTPALVHCGRTFGLSPFERELLLLVAGLELDQGLRAAVATLNSGVSSRASFELALTVLTAPHWHALSPDAALRRWRMVEPEPGTPVAQAALRIDERVLHFLAGLSATDAVLAEMTSLVGATHEADEDDLPLARRVARLLSEEERQIPIVVLQVHDRDPAACRDFALAAVSQLDRCALWIDARDLPVDSASLHRLATHIDREAALIGCVPVLSLDDFRLDAALGLASRLRSAFLWLGACPPQLMALPQSRRVLRFDLPATSAERTRAALRSRWRHAAPANAREDSATYAALDRAGSQFHLGPGVIDGIVARLQATAPGERGAAIWPAVREAARGGLDAIAQRIETRATFDDIVLPAGQNAMLRDIARHLRQRDRVYREWGFGAKHQLGQGLVALFTGESGTGKTLAAEAVANAVELDLYRIDLATLVSKYIGETEKNLKRLFAAAEASGAVLLFDEADALFGKRSEVKDSHDRYANIEVAYLLQRVEAYRGLAVLTTNMKSALDQAFLRRIRFIVSFPFPDAAARELIWRQQFPPDAPLGEIDFAALARLNLAGGNIRSVAVNAAFKAADAGRCIDQSVLMAAARSELLKLERSLMELT